MKRFSACCVILVALATTAWARIGESLDQCIDRYGPVIENRKAELPQSDSAAAVFSKNGLTVIVEFRQEKAWRIIFRKPKLSASESEALLAANSASENWSSPLRYGDREYRLSSEKNRIAIVRLTPNNEISQVEVMLREYSDQLHANALKQSLQPAADSQRPKVNPLPGF